MSKSRKRRKLSRKKKLSCLQSRTYNSSAELAIALEDLVHKCVRRSYSSCAGISPMLSSSRRQKRAFLSRKGSKSSMSRDIVFVKPSSDFSSSIVLLSSAEWLFFIHMSRLNFPGQRRVNLLATQIFFCNQTRLRQLLTESVVFHGLVLSVRCIFCLLEDRVVKEAMSLFQAFVINWNFSLLTHPDRRWERPT